MSIKNKISNFFIKKRTLPSLKREVSIPKERDLKTILIVLNNNNQDLLQFCQSSFHNSKAILLCPGTKKQKEIGQLNTFFIDQNDFGLTGSVKSDRLLLLLQENIDLVIDISENYPKLKFIISKLKAKILVGISQDDNSNQIHDIFVPLNSNKEAFIKQVKDTLNLISS